MIIFHVNKSLKIKIIFLGLLMIKFLCNFRSFFASFLACLRFHSSVLCVHSTATRSSACSTTSKVQTSRNMSSPEALLAKAHLALHLDRHEGLCILVQNTNTSNMKSIELIKIMNELVQLDHDLGKEEVQMLGYAYNSIRRLDR